MATIGTHFLRISLVSFHFISFHCRVMPSGWTKERVNEYFLWAAQVVKGCRGTNEHLEKQLDDLFQKYGVNTELLE